MEFVPANGWDGYEKGHGQVGQLPSIPTGSTGEVGLEEDEDDEDGTGIPGEDELGNKGIEEPEEGNMGTPEVPLLEEDAIATALT